MAGSAPRIAGLGAVGPGGRRTEVTTGETPGMRDCSYGTQGGNGAIDVARQAAGIAARKSQPHAG